MSPSGENTWMVFDKLARVACWLKPHMAKVNDGLQEERSYFSNIPCTDHGWENEQREERLAAPEVSGSWCTLLQGGEEVEKERNWISSWWSLMDMLCLELNGVGLVGRGVDKLSSGRWSFQLAMVSESLKRRTVGVSGETLPQPGNEKGLRGGM